MEDQDPVPMDLRAFLEWCEQQPGDIRYEFVDGVPQAMSSTTNAHDRLILSLNDLIRPRVRRKGCDAYTAGRHVPTRARDRGRSPDYLVTCDERDQRDDDDFVNGRTIRFPKLVVEVLSPTTDREDLVDKKTEYENVRSVEEYFILDGRRCWARLHRRDPATGKFGEIDFRSGDEVILSSIDLAINLDDLYADARIPAQPKRRTSRRPVKGNDGA